MDGESAKKAHLLKFCHTYPITMKVGSYTLPKKDLKNIWIMWHTPWLLLTSAIFHRKSSNLAISRNKCIDCILMQFLIILTFRKIFLIKKFTVLTMSKKMATPGLLKIKLFWNKGCEVIIYVDDVTNNFYYLIEIIL